MGGWVGGCAGEWFPKCSASATHLATPPPPPPPPRPPTSPPPPTHRPLQVPNKTVVVQSGTRHGNFMDAIWWLPKWMTCNLGFSGKTIDPHQVRVRVGELLLRGTVRGGAGVGIGIWLRLGGGVGAGLGAGFASHAINHQPPTTNHRPSTINHRPSTLAIAIAIARRTQSLWVWWLTSSTREPVRSSRLGLRPSITREPL